MTPEDLTAALARDLAGAFPAVVRSLQNSVFSGTWRMVGNRHDAEEITQETFLRAYRALREYPAERIRALDLGAWVWTIAANLCRNHHRTRSRRPATTEFTTEPPTAARGPEVEAMDRDLGERLADALVRLSFPMRAAVVLHHVVGLPYEEVARALDRPVGTVKADVHRGLARLRITLQEVTP